MNIGMDRYDLDARLKPALLTVLPLAVSVAVWLGAAWPTIAALLSLLSLCGLTYLLSRVARRLGRGIQDREYNRLGALPQTILLRHRDNGLNVNTKDRYHAFLRTHGHKIPTAAEELAAPDKADAIYASCSDFLREMTRDKKKYPLVYQENIDYGFRRNLAGLKPIALSVLSLLAIANATVISYKTSTDPTLPWAEMVLEFALLGALPIWIFVVSSQFVSDASLAYGTRLLAACEVIDSAKQNSPKRDGATTRGRKNR